VSNLEINSGYTGVLTLNRSLTVNAYSQNAGTLAEQANTLTVSGGTLDLGTGEVLFDNTGRSATHHINLNGAAAGTLTLNDLVFGDSGSGTKTYLIGAGDGLFVRGSFMAQVAATSTATMKVDGGTFDVVGGITLGTGYQPETPAPVFNPIPAGTAVISGTVFNDQSGSCQEQAIDPGLAGWTVQFLDGSQKVVASTLTGSTGGYNFLGQAPGNYTVQVLPPAGWTPTTGLTANVVGQAGASSTANFGAFQNMTLSGQAFMDRNGDGLPGWTIQLYTTSGGQLSGAPLQTTTTDSLGL
jgi:hypothetical protein